MRYWKIQLLPSCFISCREMLRYRWTEPRWQPHRRNSSLLRTICCSEVKKDAGLALKLGLWCSAGGRVPHGDSDLLICMRPTCELAPGDMAGTWSCSPIGACPWRLILPGSEGWPREPWTFTLGFCAAVTGSVDKADGGVIRAGHAFRMELGE